MNQVEALARIGSLGQPVFQTKDVAAAAGVTATNANKIATRLAASGFLIRRTRSNQRADCCAGKGAARCAIPQPDQDEAVR